MKANKLSLQVFCLLILLLFAKFNHAQHFSKTTVITECLIMKFPNEIKLFDPIQAMILKNAGTLKNDDFSFNKKSDWEKMMVDETGWFILQERSPLYAYVEYESERDETQILEAMGHDLVYVNDEPRIGNRYQTKEDFESWEPRSDYSLIPIKMKQGINRFLFQCRRNRLKIKLHVPLQKIFFNRVDATLPDVVAGQAVDDWGAIVVVNGTKEPLQHATISSADGWIAKQPVPLIPPMSVRKIGFKMKGIVPDKTGEHIIQLRLMQSTKVIAEQQIKIDVVRTNDSRKCTFVSAIDGSVQYYAINPASGNPTDPKALILSLHGAGVEAINQARSYAAKPWGHIIAPTNRRPYGFNWMDWGRQDAIEVCNLAIKELNIDPDRVYLTGHSMGGYGTWHVGVTFPHLFASIGPSAGYSNLWDYRSQRKADDQNEMQKMLQRASNHGQTAQMIKNYQQLGIYILHGSSDENVPLQHARAMIDHLRTFHHDYVYFEQPDAGHWWDVSDEPGTDCVDWQPMFDFFVRHAVPSKERIREIDFTTASPGISAINNWTCIYDQITPFTFSRVQLRLDPGMRRFTGTTENVKVFGLEMAQLTAGESILVVVDSQTISPIPFPDKGQRIWLVHQNGQWRQGEQPPASHKGPHRYGSLKDMINNHVIFVYGTNGNAEENEWAFAKARFDAETFWYQGNGSIDVMTDRHFDPQKFLDRNVVLFGNSKTNLAWQKLLKESPVKITENSIQIGERSWHGDDLACLFIRPRSDSDIASVAVIGGTGLIGMKLTTTLPYLYAGYDFPDLFLMNSEALEHDVAGVLAAGFFGSDWSVASGEFVWK